MTARAGPLRRVPVQDAPLAPDEDQIEHVAEQAGGDDQRVHELDVPALPSDVDRLAESRRADHELGRDDQDERDRGGDPQTGGDVRQRAREGDAEHATGAPQAEGARRVRRHRVGVLHPVEGLNEDLPHGREGGEEDGAAQPGAIDQDRERDQRNRGHRAQELDHRAQGPVEHPAGSEEDPERDPDRRRDREAERPALERVEHRRPETCCGRLVGELGDRVEDRREVVRGQDPDQRQDLEQGDRARDREPRQGAVGDERTPAGRRRGPRDGGLRGPLGGIAAVGGFDHGCSRIRASTSAGPSM